MTMMSPRRQADRQTAHLQAERSVGGGGSISAEQSGQTRQVEARPPEVLKVIRREKVRGRVGRVVDVIVLQQLEKTRHAMMSSDMM